MPGVEVREVAVRCVGGSATGNLPRPLRDVVKAFHRVTERAGQGIGMLHRSMGTSGAGLHRRHCPQASAKQQ